MSDYDTAKKITDNIEAAHQSLRRVATNLQRLITVGKATCTEVKAYNMYAIAVYNSQKAMLARVRAAGDKSAPALPPYPTLFAWRGVQGVDALKVDCAAAGMAGVPFGAYNLGDPALGSVIAEAMQSSTNPASPLVSSAQINIITSDSQLSLKEQDFPSLAQVTNAGLGVAPVFIIAAIAIVATAAVVVAVFEYLKESKIQEETSARTRQQVAAYENYTAARAACYTDCINRGNSVEGCVKQCAKLTTEPSIDTKKPAAPKGGGLSTLETVGLVTIASIGGVIAFVLYRRRAQLARGFRSVRESISPRDVIDVEVA